MAVNYTYLLPIVIFVWFPATFVVTYIMAVLRKNVNPLFPYISDTGTFSPESCIFGQMLNAGAILNLPIIEDSEKSGSESEDDLNKETTAKNTEEFVKLQADNMDSINTKTAKKKKTQQNVGLFVYVRHRHVREVCERHVLGEKIKRKDRLSAWFGFSAAFGVTIVGNFQETNILLVHMFGAFLAFGLGTVWECLQTWVSFQLHPSIGTKTTNVIRLALSIICSICFTISFVFAGLALLKFKGDDITKWDKDDGGYEFHITSTVTEWIVVFCTMGYILSYSSELRNVTFDEPRIQIGDKETNNSENIVTSESIHSSRADTLDRY